MGYRPGSGLDLSPLMFSEDEAKALLPAAARAAAESQAVQAQRKVQFNFRDLKEKAGQRTVRPLGCFYWGKVWTLTAWCEARGAFRDFRMDHIQCFGLLAVGFKQEAGKTLADFLRTLGAVPLLG